MGLVKGHYGNSLPDEYRVVFPLLG
jgi:hypothetical protein